MEVEQQEVGGHLVAHLVRLLRYMEALVILVEVMPIVKLIRTLLEAVVVRALQVQMHLLLIEVVMVVMDYKFSLVQI